MADAIRFKEFLVANTISNKTIEENVKTLFGYGGIHDRIFDDTLNDAFAALDAAVWDTVGALGTWEIVSGQLRGTGPGGAAWGHLLSINNMPSEAVLAVYKNCDRGGLWFRTTDSDNGYLFFWDSNSCGFKKKVSGNWITLVDVPKVFIGEGDIVLSWREIKFGATVDEKWFFMSAWVDGELVCTTEDNITSSAPGHKIGFAVYDEDLTYFDNIHIPELTDVIEWCSLDIGENPASALSRMIGRRHIKYFLRYNGTLRMWRPKVAASTWTYQRHITGFNWNVDSRDLVSHWRQVGAWEEADKLDTGLLQKGITRFHKDSNPDLMTRESCYIEAGYALQRLKELADQVDLEVPTQVLQEPEDVITLFFERDGNVIIDNVDYIVDLEEAYTIRFQDKKLKTDLHSRKLET